MKNIKYIIFLLCMSLCSAFATEHPSSQPGKVPRLVLGAHQRQRSKSDPTTTTPVHIVISPRKKESSSHLPKHEKETRACGKESISPRQRHSFSRTKSFVDLIAHEDKATLLDHRETILIKLNELKKKQEHCEWVIDDTTRELEELGECGRRECLPICNSQHVTKEQKHKMQKILQKIEALARDELWRKQMFSCELKLVLHNIQRREHELEQIQVLLDQNGDNVEEAA